MVMMLNPKSKHYMSKAWTKVLNLAGLGKEWDEGEWHFVPKLVPILLDHTRVTYFKIYINRPCKVLKIDQNQDHDKQPIS